METFLALLEEYGLLVYALPIRLLQFEEWSTPPIRGFRGLQGRIGPKYRSDLELCGWVSGR